MGADSARQAVIDAIVAGLPSTTQLVDELAGRVIDVLAEDDLAFLHHANYPLVLVRSADETDSLILDREHTARTYLVPIAAAAFDIDDTLSGRRLTDVLTGAVRSILLSRPSIAGMRLMDVAGAKTGVAGSVGEAVITVAEFDLTLWSVEATVIPSGIEPVIVTATEVTVTAADPNGE